MSSQQHVPGARAQRPQEIPRRGWLQVARRGWAEAKTDQVPLLAAGVAFYAFLALFPAMIALTLVYGLVADPSQIANQIGQLTDALPDAARTLITDQLQSLSGRSTGVGVGAIFSILVALWSASGGVNNLLQAINTAYDEEDTRSFVRKRALALVITLAAIVFMVLMLGLVALLPALLGAIENTVVRVLLEAARWIVLAVVVSVALAILYRVGPQRDAPKIRWVSVGAVLATLLWIIASVGFSVYAGFGSYSKTYGALAGIVVLLFWLWITAYAILLGAEINAEAEEQTVMDTTHGPAQPIGARNAVKADSVPTGAAPVSDHGRDHDRPHEDQEKTMSDDHRSSPDPTAAEPSGERSIADLVRQLSEHSSRLVRDELQLAQAELTTKLKSLGTGVGAFGVAGVLALFGLGVLLAAAVLGLALVVPAWLAAVIVGAAVLVVAAVVALVGRRKVDEGTPPIPQRTVATVKDDINEIKESARS